MTDSRTPLMYLMATLCALLIASPAAYAQSADDPSYQVAREVPEYGGAFWEGDTLVINLTTNTPAVLSRAHEALIRFEGSEYDVEDVVGRDARYSWSELQNWFVSLLRELDVEGIVYVGHSHRLNRLTVAVASERHRPAVEATVEELGIPRDAVVMPVKAPIEPIPGRSSSQSQMWLLPAIAAALVVGLGYGGFRLRRRRSRSSSEDRRPAGTPTDPGQPIQGEPVSHADRGAAVPGTEPGSPPAGHALGLDLIRHAGTWWGGDCVGR